MIKCPSVWASAVSEVTEIEIKNIPKGFEML